MTSFANAVAVVTGGASGIGRAVCAALAQAGACVVVADINVEGARRVADALPNALAQQADVTDFASMQALIEATMVRHGRVDYFFNNAGIATVGEVHDLVPEDWRKVIDVNLTGVVNGIHAVYPRMIAQGSGHIVNTGSIAGLIPVPTAAAYTATKHAVLGLSQSLRHEAKAFGIKVSVVCPGFVDTPIYDASERGGRLKNVRKEAVRGTVPFKHISAEQAAQIILRGVVRNQAVIPFPFSTRLMWWLYRLNPALLTPIYDSTLRKIRASRSA